MVYISKRNGPRIEIRWIALQCPMHDMRLLLYLGPPNYMCTVFHYIHTVSRVQIKFCQKTKTKFAKMNNTMTSTPTHRQRTYMSGWRTAMTGSQRNSFSVQFVHHRPSNTVMKVAVDCKDQCKTHRTI